MTRKLTIRVDEALHRRLRIMSVETNEPLQQMVLRLLREDLERYERGKARKGGGRP